MKHLFRHNWIQTVKLSIAVILMISMQAGMAQAQKVVNVPLTNPGKPGKLRMNTTFGLIKVVGYDGKDVKITSAPKGHREHGNSGGMKRIPNSSLRLTITEEDNYVKISTSTHTRMLYTIQVPRKFDLKLGMTNGGRMEIENIEGEIEASNVNGSIYAKKISGSMLANTVNGSIVVGFDKVKPNTPMSFRGLNGKIDVTLPKSVKATLKMRSDRGEIYSDFEMDIEDKPAIVRKGGTQKRITVNRWVMGKVNGGGPTFTCKNMNGNIYIRQK